MGFLSNIFKAKTEQKINNNAEFWDWFLTKEKEFHQSVKTHENIEESFFDKLTPKLESLREGYFFLAGMKDDDTAELILTADGNIKNMVFVEELIACSPKIKGWSFIAHKPSSGAGDFNIKMHDLDFNFKNLSFYSVEDKNRPDFIELKIVHQNWSEENQEEITNGTFIFIDNLIGELNSLALIDNLEVIAPAEIQKELIPMSKLEDFLIWREKEFIEKYDGLRYTTEHDTYATFEGEVEQGLPAIAVINTSLISWDAKASHPWVCKVILTYDGSKNNGMPNSDIYNVLDAIEEEIGAYLVDFDGYLNVGRETSNGERIIFFACKDFRRPSKILDDLSLNEDNKVTVSFNLFKDKYWVCLSNFEQ